MWRTQDQVTTRVKFPSTSVSKWNTLVFNILPSLHTIRTTTSQPNLPQTITSPANLLETTITSPANQEITNFPNLETINFPNLEISTSPNQEERSKSPRSPTKFPRLSIFRVLKM
uniref:Uncharacterized protein n=1 Tax=Cacopsylla melanoneura TaxID=428564 RepID=A0A8D8RBA2_9HEMI